MNWSGPFLTDVIRSRDRTTNTGENFNMFDQKEEDGQNTRTRVQLGTRVKWMTVGLVLGLFAAVPFFRTILVTLVLALLFLALAGIGLKFKGTMSWSDSLDLVLTFAADRMERVIDFWMGPKEDRDRDWPGDV